MGVGTYISKISFFFSFNFFIFGKVLRFTVVTRVLIRGIGESGFFMDSLTI